MGKEASFLGLAVAPLLLAFSSAFVVVPPTGAGAGSSTFAPAAASACAAVSVGPTAAARLDLRPLSLGSPAMAMSDEVDNQEHCQQDEQDRQLECASRGQFIRRVSTAGAAAAIAGASAGGLGAGVPPALADSTGKYSSKATAKKRYLPRIVKLVTAFQVLKKDIAGGSASAKSEFFVDLLPDSVSAMDLYGSSMKKGEMPDSKSKALQQLAQDFGATCGSIGKSLGKKGGEADAGKAYDKASEILVQYLKGVELDPLGSDVYN